MPARFARAAGHLRAQPRLGFGATPILHDVSFAYAPARRWIVGRPAREDHSRSICWRVLRSDVLRSAVDERTCSLPPHDLHDKVAIVTQDRFSHDLDRRQHPPRQTLVDRCRSEKRRARRRSTTTSGHARGIRDARRTVATDAVARPPSTARDTSPGPSSRTLRSSLLDEATSSLDSYAEARGNGAIDRLVVGRWPSRSASPLDVAQCIAHPRARERRRRRTGNARRTLRESPTYQRLWEAQPTCHPQEATVDDSFPRAGRRAPLPQYLDVRGRSIADRFRDRGVREPAACVSRRGTYVFSALEQLRRADGAPRRASARATLGMRGVSSSIVRDGRCAATSSWPSCGDCSSTSTAPYAPRGSQRFALPSSSAASARMMARCRRC